MGALELRCALFATGVLALNPRAPVTQRPAGSHAARRQGLEWRRQDAARWRRPARLQEGRLGRQPGPRQGARRLAQARQGRHQDPADAQVGQGRARQARQDREPGVPRPRLLRRPGAHGGLRPRAAGPALVRQHARHRADGAGPLPRRRGGAGRRPLHGRAAHQVRAHGPAGGPALERPRAPPERGLLRRDLRRPGRPAPQAPAPGRGPRGRGGLHGRGRGRGHGLRRGRRRPRARARTPSCWRPRARRPRRATRSSTRA